MALIEIDGLPFLKMGRSFHGKLWMSQPEGISPWFIDISTIHPSYWSYLHQLRVISLMITLVTWTMDPDRLYDGESTTSGTILWYQDLSSPTVAWLSWIWLVARRSSWLSWFMDLSPKSSAMRQHFGRNGWSIMTRLPPPQIHGAEIG